MNVYLNIKMENNSSGKKKKGVSWVVDKFLNLFLIACGVVVIWILLQVTSIATFKIPSDSMEPALLAGDNILVNKWVMGGRIFNIWDALEGKEVKISRLPGLGKIRRNEVISRVRGVPEKLNFFIGIQSARSNLKGTDVMLPVLQEVQRKYSELCRITEVHDVPYARYQQLMDDADVQLDQLYSYTPSMNSLLAMAKGVTVVGGGEPENYEILNETELRPIINVLPDEQDIYQKLEDIVLHKERIPELSAQSIEYVAKYHDHVKVARQYLDFWEKH